MKNLKLLFASVLLIVFASASVKAQTHKWRVNNNPAYNQAVAGVTVFNDLQQAISTVAAGDTLYVESSLNDYGIITINKEIHLIGTGYFLDQNEGLQNHLESAKIRRVIFAAGASGSTLQGLEITGQASTVGITFNNTALSNIAISRCKVSSTIDFDNNASNTISNIVIKKCHLYGFSGSSGLVTGFTITNNIIRYFNLIPNLQATVSQNVFLNNVNFYGQTFFNNILLGEISENTNNTVNVHHNIFTIPQPNWLIGGVNSFGMQQANIFLSLTGTDDEKYKVKPVAQCAACYAGSPANVQIGAFGGSDPYLLSGIPPIPTIYLLQSSATATSPGSYDVLISTKANH